MGAFGGLILTNKGRSLQAKAQTGTQLNITKVKIGDGELSGQSILELNDLISIKKELSILELKTLPEGKASLKSYLSNADIVTGFYWRELGIFAQDPDEGEILYCYGNAGSNAEYIPAGGGADVVEKYVNVVTIIDNASNVSATLGSEIYATQVDFNDHVDDPEAVAHPEADRTLNPTETPAGNVGPLSAILNWFANRIKAITGKTYWYESPTKNLEQLNNEVVAHLAETMNPHQITAAQVGAATQTDFDIHLANYIPHISYAVCSGSANTYSVTLNPAPTSYTEGIAIAVKINVDNTSASTINVNGLGAKAIKKPNGNDVSAGNLKAGSIYSLRYNGTNFILQGSDAAGNATPVDVLSGKTFTNDQGEQTGTMPNRGQQIITPGTSNIAIPTGYHNGAGYVVGDADLVASNVRSGANIFGVVGKSSVVDTADADAVAGNILSAKTAYVNGSKLTGSMANRGAYNITPGATDKTIPQGYHSGGGVVYGDADLVSTNILQGKNIFGVAGSAQPRQGIVLLGQATQCVDWIQGYQNGDTDNYIESWNYNDSDGGYCIKMRNGLTIYDEISVVTNEPVNLTGVNYLYYTVEHSYNKTFLVISTTRGISALGSYTARVQILSTSPKTLAFDVSALSGNYYISVNLVNDDGTSAYGLTMLYNIFMR